MEEIAKQLSDINTMLTVIAVALIFIMLFRH